MGLKFMYDGNYVQYFFYGSLQSFNHNETWSNDNLSVSDREENQFIDIAMVAQGEHYVQSALTLLKSIVLFTSVNVNFNIYAFDNSPKPLINNITQWPYWVKQKFTIMQYLLNCTKWKSEFDNFEKFQQFAPKVCLYLTLHKNSTLKKVLILDADLIVITDLLKLWKVFNSFNASHTMAMALGGRRYYILREHNRLRQPIYGKYGLNSGVVLIDLEMSRSVKYAENLTYNINTRRNTISKHGDQDLSNMFFGEYPQYLYYLSCDWNVRLPFDNCSREFEKELHCKEMWENGISIIHSTAHEKLVRKGIYGVFHQALESYDIYNPTNTSWFSVESLFLQRRFQHCGDHGASLVKAFHKSRISIENNK